MKRMIGAAAVALCCAANGVAAPTPQAEARRMAIVFLAGEKARPDEAELRAGQDRAQFLYAVKGAVGAVRLHGLACFPAGSTYEGIATEVAARIVGQATLHGLDVGAAVAIAAVDMWPCTEGQTSARPK